MSDSGHVSRTRELVYEMKVESVMSSPAITVTPDTRMIDLRTLLRDNRISGAPVVEDSRVIGIVSVEDFIEWLAQGAPDCAVRDRMSTRVVTVFAEEPLVHVVSILEEPLSSSGESAGEIPLSIAVVLTGP